MDAYASNKEVLMKLQTREEVDKYFEDQAHFYLAKKKLETIDNFNGVFDFLNNEYPCEVFYEGRIFPSVFHAFQAGRTEKDHERAKISLAESMQELYELASEIENPPDWQSKRLVVMEKWIRDKFRRHRELKEKLRKTGNRDLVNSYADKSTSNIYWGVVDGKGQNHLGIILQNVRIDIHEDRELFRWLYMLFEPEEDKLLMPKLKVEVFKEDNLVDTINLMQKPYYIFGNMKTCDVALAHKSISRRHLCLLVDKNKGVLLVDIGSKGGTFLNGNRIKDHFPFPLKTGDWFGVAASTRSYSVTVDFKEVQEYLKKKQKNLEMDLKILDLQKGLDNKEDIVKASLGILKQDTIFISGLPDIISEKEIRDAFVQFGTLESIRIPVNQQTGNSKNIAFIKFSKEEEAKLAFQAVRIPIKDKLVKIRFAEKNKSQILGELERAKKREDKDKGKDKDKKIDKKDVDRLYRDHKSRHRRRSSSDSRDKIRKDRSRNGSLEKKRDRYRDKSKDRPRNKSRKRSRDRKRESSSSRRKHKRKDDRKPRKEETKKKDKKHEEKSKVEEKEEAIKREKEVKVEKEKVESVIESWSTVSLKDEASSKSIKMKRKSRSRSKERTRKEVSPSSSSSDLSD